MPTPEQYDLEQFIRTILNRIDSLEKRLNYLETSVGVLSIMSVTSDSDNVITDTSSFKRMTLQRRFAPPTNAAYIAFSNNPGSSTFYLVLEDA
ncbi:MAG TPA: hypothetical protein PKD55_00205 [Bellilinea sp.]|nr:hypothetical protein [Bellilinea sp.]